MIPNLIKKRKIMENNNNIGIDIKNNNNNNKFETNTIINSIFITTGGDDSHNRDDYPPKSISKSKHLTVSSHNTNNNIPMDINIISNGYNLNKNIAESSFSSELFSNNLTNPSYNANNNNDDTDDNLYNNNDDDDDDESNIYYEKNKIKNQNVDDKQPNGIVMEKPIRENEEFITANSNNNNNSNSNNSNTNIDEKVFHYNNNNNSITNIDDKVFHYDNITFVSERSNHYNPTKINNASNNNQTNLFDHVDSKKNINAIKPIKNKQEQNNIMNSYDIIIEIIDNNNKHNYNL
ncbi:hypothetical protein PIROE2DRAFT_12492 [Piromyces sp. E2]|nr:hypothetical protein PIROE2DRAFT_12492 [Piromyces sp. E2]|eukprot:OUM61494.1 hypothetical protein PIROE2DRAFT_12492 [Piromyces sp. E2]